MASYYASSHPDGLKFVAEKTGFIDQEKQSPTADGPLADYSTKGIDNDRLSGGVAGVAGCLLVLGIGGGTVLGAARDATPSTDTSARPEPWAPGTATGCTTTGTASSTGLRRT